MKKRVIMLGLLAGVFVLGTACFQRFSQPSNEGESKVEACKGLSGQAKIDCEKRQAGG
jgi:hypothetical protein